MFALRLLYCVVLFGIGQATLTACADTCTGSIETTVLYAKPGPKGVGRRIYVDVVNQPGLGIQKTLLYEGKEFGTFPHVAILYDSTNRYAANRRICFSGYRLVAAEPDGDLAEQDIPRLVVTP